jgi:uncharacterized protein (DUF1015 family)
VVKIKSFQALIFNQDKIKDISKVACPPYDVISPEKQQYYHALHPNNLIHVLLAQDTSQEDKYLRAGNYFRDWLKSKILIKDNQPAIYFYSQQFILRGEKRTRLGFISLLRLSEPGSGIFKHEHTRLEAKEDRLKLIRQVNANLSPIFAVFPDKKRIVQRVYQQDIAMRVPFINITDEDKTEHLVWRLDAARTIALMQDALFSEDIFIADGHHRYEVACAFRDEMKQKLGGAFTGEESFNYILTYFTNTDPRGLTILPIHRLIEPAGLELETFRSQLKEYFDVEEIKDKSRFFFLMEKGGRTEHLLGVYKDKKFLLLRLKNIKILDKLLSDKPKDYRTLDVSILNTLVFKKMLGLDLENKGNIVYSPNPDEFIQRVDSDPGKIAFFLNPVKIQQIMSVAIAAQMMPAKSTFFYPKVLSGLVINKFEE